MTRSESLIIPGPDGDDLLDVNAAARMLGVKASTLRSHQYQDRRHEGREPWPQPEDPDEVEIALPDGAGIEWARAIDELLLRSGGAGRPVTLWRRSVLAAFKADRMAAGTFAARPAAQDRVGEIEAAVGPLEPWQRDVADAVARGGRVTQDARGRDVLLVPSLEPGDVSFEGSSVQSGDGASTASVVNLYADVVVSVAPDLDANQEGYLISRSSGRVTRLAQAVEQFAEQNPDGEMIEVSRDQGFKRLTATEVLERARLRREGKLDG